MTPKQKKLRDYIAAYIDEHDVAPTYDEMLAHMGAKSKSQIAGMVTALVRQRYLTRTKNHARSLRVVSDEKYEASRANRAVAQLATAGVGLLVEINNDDGIDLPPELADRIGLHVEAYMNQLGGTA